MILYMVQNCVGQKKRLFTQTKDILSTGNLGRWRILGEVRQPRPHQCSVVLESAQGMFLLYLRLNSASQLLLCA